MLRVGLTGGIACGKSHVLRRLAARGCHTLDLDAVAREVTAAGGPALGEIAAAFGREVLDARGGLDRAALGARVFADAGAREQLNRIVHPRVREAEAAWAAGFREGPDAVLVTDGALIVESGFQLRFDRLAVVHCAPGLQLARLRQRDGLDERAARARIEAQLSSAEKLAFAHFEVDTSGSPGETDRAADALAETLARLARRPGEWHDSHGPRHPLERLLGGLVHGPVEGPRGLSPRVLLAEAAEAGGLEMERLAGRLVPRPRGAWYRAADELVPDAPASRLAVALAAWAVQRRADDVDFVAWAAASVARLTHADPGGRADACLAALAARERASAPADAPRFPVPAAERVALAIRFGGGPPTGRLDAAWAALERFGSDPLAAGRLCRELGGDAATAQALAGIGRRAEPEEAAREWRGLLRQA